MNLPLIWVETPLISVYKYRTNLYSVPFTFARSRKCNCDVEFGNRPSLKSVDG